MAAGQTLPNATPPIGKIQPSCKTAVTFEPMKKIFFEIYNVLNLCNNVNLWLEALWEAPGGKSSSGWDIFHKRGGGVQPKSKPFEGLFLATFLSLSLDNFQGKGVVEEFYHHELGHFPTFWGTFAFMKFGRQKKFLVVSTDTRGDSQGNLENVQSQTAFPPRCFPISYPWSLELP